MNEIQEIELDMLKELEIIAKKYSLPYYLAYGTALGAVREKGFIPWDTDVDIVIKYDIYDLLCKKLKEELSEKYMLIYYKYDTKYDSLKARICKKNEDHHTIHIDLFPLVGAPAKKNKQQRFVRITHIVYRLYFAKKLKSLQLYRNNKIKLLISILVKIPLLFIPSKLLIRIYEELCLKYPINTAEYYHNPCGSYGIREIIPKSFIGNGDTMSFENINLPVPELYHEYLSHMYGPDYMIPKQRNY